MRKVQVVSILGLLLEHIPHLAIANGGLAFRALVPHIIRIFYYRVSIGVGKIRIRGYCAAGRWIVCTASTPPTACNL
jgi:hypothetical protein